MKHLLIAFALSSFFTGIAQGNLQFNQAKIISNTDPPQTVPAGKVWKIESVFSDASADTYAVDGSGATQAFISASGIPSFYFHYYGRYLAINSIPLSFGIHSAGNQMTNLPIWVPGGSTICTCTSPSYCARGYSVIEFNIVP
jgi:hypothetical protein